MADTDVNANINVRVKDEGFDKLDLAKKGLLGIGVAGGALAVGLGAAVKASMDWNSQMDNLQGNSGATDKQMSQLSDSIKKMAAGTSETMDQLAGGVGHAFNFGFTRAADAVKVTQAAMEAAIATGGKTSDMANTLASSMSNYGIKAADAGKTMNLLYVTAQQGNLHLADFAANFSTVGPTAHAAGISLGEASAALVAMTRTGKDAATSATDVRAMMQGLVIHSSSVTASMKTMGKAAGVDLVGDIAKMQKGTLPMSAVLKDLETATGGNITKMHELFPNVRALDAAMRLAGPGAKDLNDIMKAQHTQLGALHDQYTKQSGDIDFVMGRLRNMGQTALIAIGDRLAPTISGFLKSLTGFGDWFQKNQKTIDAFFNGLGDAAKNAMGAVGGAIKGAVGYLETLFNTIKGSKRDMADLEAVWTNLKATGKALGDAVGVIASGFTSLLPMSAKGKSSFSDVNGVASTLTSTLKTLSEGIRAGAEAFSHVSGVVAPLLIAFGTYKVVTTAARVATEAWTAAQLLLDAALEANPIGLTIAAVAGLAAGIIYAYKNIKPFHDAVDQAWAKVKDFASAVADASKSVVSSVQSLWDKITSAFNNIKGVLSGFGDWLGSHWKEVVFVALTGFIGAAVVLWQNFGPQIMKTMGDLAGKLTGWMGDRLKDFTSWGAKLPGEIAHGLMSGVDALAKGLEHLFTAAIDKAKEGLTSPLKALGSWVGDQLSKIPNPFGGGGSPVFAQGGGSGHPGASFFGLPPTGIGAGPAGLAGVANAAGHLDFMGEFNNPFYLPKGGQYQFQSQGVYPWGETEYWRTPNGGTFDFMHMNSMPSFRPGQVYPGGTYAGRSGGVPGVSPGLQAQYSTGAHLHTGYDAAALAYFQAMGGGYVSGPGTGPYGTGSGYGGGRGLMSGNVTTATIHATTAHLNAPLAIPTGKKSATDYDTTDRRTYGAPTSGPGAQGYGQAVWQYPGGANAGQLPGYGQAVWRFPGGDASGLGNVYGYGTGHVRDDPQAVARANADMARQLAIMDAVRSPAPRLADIYTQQQTARSAEITRLTARAGEQLAMGGAQTANQGMRVSLPDATRPTVVTMPNTSALDHTIATLAADMAKADTAAKQAEEVQRRVAKVNGDFATQQSISNNRLSKATNDYANGILSGAKNMPQLGANLDKAVGNAARFSDAMAKAQAEVTKAEHDRLVASESQTKTYTGQMKLASDAVASTRQAYLDAAVGGKASAEQLGQLANNAGAAQGQLDLLNDASTKLDTTIAAMNGPAKSLADSMTAAANSALAQARAGYIQEALTTNNTAVLQGFITAGLAATGQLNQVSAAGAAFDAAMSKHVNTVLEQNNADVQALQATLDNAKALLVHELATTNDAAAIARLTGDVTSAASALGKIQGIIAKVDAIASAAPTPSAGGGAAAGPGSINQASPYNNAPNANTLAQLKAGGPANGVGGTLLGFDSNGNPVYQDVGGGTRTDLLGSYQPGGAPLESPGQPGAGGGMNYPGGGGSYPGISGGGGGMAGVGEALTPNAGQYAGYGALTPGAGGNAPLGGGTASSASTYALSPAQIAAIGGLSDKLPFGGATLANANPGIFGVSQASHDFNEQQGKYGQGTSLDAVAYNNLYGSNSSYRASPWVVQSSLPGAAPDALGTANNPINTEPNQAQLDTAAALQQQLDDQKVVIARLTMVADNMREILRINQEASRLDIVESGGSFETAINNAGVARTADR